MNSSEEKFNIGKQLHFSGRIEEAQKIYLQLIKKHKTNHTLYYLLGTSFLQLKKYDEAIENLKLSLRYNSNFAETFNNLGIALAKKKNYTEALINYKQAIKIKPTFLDAYLNRGISFNKLKEYQNAIKDFNFVINNDSKNSKAYNNLGNVYKNLKQFDQAIYFYDKAIKNNNNFFEAISNKADAFESKKKFKESLIELNKIYKKEPDFFGVIQKILSHKMSIFDWENLNEIKEIAKKKLLNNNLILDPLFVYYLFDDLNIKKKNSTNFIKKEFSNYKKIGFSLKKRNKNKIRLGYFSGDFHNHPVMHIMSDIYKHHDKKKFEIFAYSHGPERKKNVWKENIVGYFKKFYEISNWSDSEIINQAKKDGIDIAIDLTGSTKYSRTSLFFNRIAPIQINYLGYPGTLGLETMDYILADQIVIKDGDKKYYSEEVCYLPKCYIPSSNDVTIKSSKKKYTRAEFDLPENEIVFCAFHNPHKINPEIFNVWMKILNKTKKSVLWVKSNDTVAKENLKKEAKKRGVNSNRIIFTDGFVENINDHLERLKLADIILDTFPFGSHSTVYDYIRANVPMVAMQGNSFSARVGSSIYSSLDLSELVAKSEIEYFEIAVKLATDKDKLLNIKEKIKTQINQHYLFNTNEFTLDLEKIYSNLYNKHLL